LELESFVRKAVSVEIVLVNPLNEALIFDVMVKGDGIFGAPAFQLGPREKGKYELMYSPLLPGISTGAIFFINQQVGELWYELKLNAIEQPPQELEMLQCELGKNASHHVIIENPSSDEIILEYSCDNRLNFDILPDKVALPPYEAVDCYIKYTPTSLNNIEYGEIRLSHPKVG